MLSIYEFAALGTALSWAIGSLLSQYSVRHLGTWAFNRYRLSIASTFLLIIVVLTGAWRDYPKAQVTLALLSGFVGIFCGDSILFACFSRLGARRSTAIYAMNAPITVIIGYFFLDEKLSQPKLIGIALAIVGVVLAIVYGSRKDNKSAWDEVRGQLWIGVSYGLLGALGQSVGSIIIRPVMLAGADPIFTSFLRVSIAALAFVIMGIVLPHFTRSREPITKQIFLTVSAQAFIAMVIGMTLILFAFRGAETGIVATLSATTPIMVLPILWLISKERPNLGAWVGATLVVVGTGMIAIG